MTNRGATELAHYIDRIRERTMRVVHCIPPDKMDWTYREGKFTFGDLMRHLAAIERWMFAENALRKPSRYPGHGRDLAMSMRLRSMIEHEVHHREQIYLDLGMLAIPAPPLYGLTEEEVQRRSSSTP